MNTKEIDITKYADYAASDELLQKLFTKEFIELMNKTPFDSDLFKRIVENS